MPSQDGSISMLTIIWEFSYSTTTYCSIFSRSSSTLSHIFRTFSIDSEPLIKKYGLTVSLLEEGSRKINLSSNSFLMLIKRIPPEIKYFMKIFWYFLVMGRTMVYVGLFETKNWIFELDYHNTQCRSFRIFLTLRIYVKSISIYKLWIVILWNFAVFEANVPNW